MSLNIDQSPFAGMPYEFHNEEQAAPISAGLSCQKEHQPLGITTRRRNFGPQPVSNA